MEVIAGVVACTVVPLVYTQLRKRIHTKVNCWFCQHDQRVPYEQRNSFICSFCEQYNGFNETGGYNRKIPGQHCIGAPSPPMRFCTPMKNKLSRPDVVPQGGYASNGLCDNCNKQQEIIMRKVADFEPLEEERWSEELEMFRYKLNKAYPLCARCTFFTQNRMQEEKRKYAHLVALKTVANSIANGISSVTSIARKAVRRRRQFFAGGIVVEVLHAVSLVLSLLLFISQFNYLQEDSMLYQMPVVNIQSSMGGRERSFVCEHLHDLPPSVSYVRFLVTCVRYDAELDLIRLPMFVQRTLPMILDVAYHLVGSLLGAHVITLWTNKCRTTLPDLLLPMVAVLHLTSFCLPLDVYREDLALFRCAFASFETLLSTAITFVPRKKLHRKHPNRVLSSAFSIASTPMSQCSSQATSCNNSMTVEKPKSGEEGDKGATPTIAVRQLNKWREREQTPESVNSPLHKRASYEHEEMDWESSMTGGKPSSVIRPSEMMARMVRETTPTRELAPSLSSLSLFCESQTSKGGISGNVISRRGPFVTSEMNNFRQYARSVAHSQFSTKTDVTKLPSIRSLRRDVSPTRSVFTSISQREEKSSNRWLTPVLVVFAAVSLIGNIAMFYLVFKK